MPLPSDRFRSAGATAAEVAELEARYDALSPVEQAAEDAAYASVDNVALIGILDGVREGALPADDDEGEGEGAEGDESAAGGKDGADAETPEKPKRGKAA